MNLSRAAKKLREKMPAPAAAPAAPVEAKNDKKKEKQAPPAPVAPPPPPVEVVAPPEPEPAPPVAEPTPAPKKERPPKVKRPRFVFVREKTEKRPAPTGPALPPRSTKFTAQLLTKNLSLPPEDETPKTGR
jgi:DNA polymerase-3 subunit gamma/tau